MLRLLPEMIHLPRLPSRCIQLLVPFAPPPPPKKKKNLLETDISVYHNGDLDLKLVVRGIVFRLNVTFKVDL